MTSPLREYRIALRAAVHDHAGQRARADSNIAVLAARSAHAAGARRRSRRCRIWSVARPIVITGASIILSCVFDSAGRVPS